MHTSGSSQTAFWAVQVFNEMITSGNSLSQRPCEAVIENTQLLNLVRIQIYLKGIGAGRAPDPWGCLNSAIQVLDT